MYRRKAAHFSRNLPKKEDSSVSSGCEDYSFHKIDTDDMPRLGTLHTFAPSENSKEQVRSKFASFAHPDKEVLSQSFCRQYSKIKLNHEASFQERMQFDIFKRNTKHRRMETLERKSKQTLSPEKADELYNRLIIDGKKRIIRTKLTEDEQVKKEAYKNANSRKLTVQESEELYQRLVERARKVNEKVEAQRLEKQRQIEKEEKELCKMHKSKNFELKGLVHRMCKDVERRRINLENAKKRQKEKENEKVKGYFIPTTNYRNKSKVDANRMKSNNMEKDEDKRKNAWLYIEGEEETARCDLSNLNIIVMRNLKELIRPNRTRLRRE